MSDLPAASTSIPLSRIPAMEHLDPLIASALGFDPDQPFEPAGDLVVRAPALDTGSVSGALLVLATLVQTQIAHDPYFRDDLAPPALAPAVRSELKPWARDPRLFLLRTADPAVTVRGEDPARMVRVSPQEVIVDARSGPFHLCLGLDDVRQVLSVSPTTVRVLSPGAYTAPEADEVFAGLDPPPWMRQGLAAGLAAGTPWALTAAWGTAVRLAPPKPGIGLLDLLDAPPPEAAAQAWIAHHPGLREALVAQLVREADRLEAALPDLAEAVIAEDPEARTRVLDWLHRRDDLASVASLLASPPQHPAPRVTEALTRVDHAAALGQTLFAFLDPFDDPRLGAVSWADPAAWWATVPLGLHPPSSDSRSPY